MHAKRHHIKGQCGDSKDHGDDDREERQASENAEDQQDGRQHFRYVTEVHKDTRHTDVFQQLLLIGNAVHTLHPVAGQGFNLGLRDVAALTEVLVEAARRGEDLGSLIVLQRYEQWRRFDATAMALGMDGLNRLFSSAVGPVQALRSAGLRLAGGMGLARRGFMGLASGTSGEVPALLRGRPV